MSFFSSSINLKWIHRCEGSFGMGVHCLADSGAVSLLVRDKAAARNYLVESLIPYIDNKPEQVHRSSFVSEAILAAACASDGSSAYVLTESDLLFVVIDDAGTLQRVSLQIRYGDMFLDLQAAGSDHRRTATILTQDRAATGYTVTLIESPDPSHTSGVLRVLWSKTWSEAIQLTAISCDGNFVAIAHRNGNISLMNRLRRTLWVYTSSQETPIAAIAVDRAGNVVALDSRGVIQRHEASDGSIAWQAHVHVGENQPSHNPPSTMICVDGQMQTVLCATNWIDSFDDAESSYTFLDGDTGSVLWEDESESPIAGISLSPAGNHGSLLCINGDVMLFGVESGEQRLAIAESPSVQISGVQELLVEAQRAYDTYHFDHAVRMLNQAFELSPMLSGFGSLYDDAVWHLRQSVMNETKTISAASLAKADAALELLPHDERLTVRRNALARLLAESLGREAGECISEGQFEDALTKLTEAVSIDRTQTELRNMLRSTSDQLALNLIKQADEAFHNEQFESAIAMLERVEELRPGEPAIVKRLEHAKGLQAFATGMRLYIEQRTQEAAFWFRKTLSILPDHEEAASYLAFADGAVKQPVESNEDLEAVAFPRVRVKFGKRK